MVKMDFFAFYARKEPWKRALVLAAFIALAACQTTGGTFCDIAKPIRLTDAQVDALTDAQVADLLAHNRKGQKLCGWKPS